MKTKLPYIVMLLPALLHAQEQQLFHGRVVSGSIPAEGQLVVNLSSQREVRADSLGNFTFMAKPGDTIVAAIKKPKNIVLEEADFNKNPFLIDIPSYELDEVVITKYNNINAIALRIVPKGMAVYTVAERRRRATAGMMPYLDNTMTGGFVPLDPLYNLINGKSVVSKRALESERKEIILDKLSGLFNEDEIIELFQIPKEYVNGFLFYITEDPAFVASLNAKNKMMLELMGNLAMKYLELIKDEN